MTWLDNLPHQIPFRAASSGVRIDDKTIEGTFLCTANDMLPLEVMAVEAMAQLAGGLVFEQQGFLTGVDACEIDRAIPVGFESHKRPLDRREDRKLWEEFDHLTPAVKDLLGKARGQLGTLGGGNHFIELCLDTEDRVWLMLHSGSRNIGKSLAEIHIGRAKKLSHNRDLPDRDLAVFLAGTPEMAEYRRDLFWAALRPREP